ncbi:MAG: LysM peptidoglycan-binding domain-containing protein [Akkermansia sp.]|nr:LysM peptidoglycan-binding domain-containing protein [Akkermansia sp.]
MSKKQKSAFHNSDLGRSKPKRHFIKTFVDSNLKQPRRLHSDTGLVVDRTSPATVIRVILGLIVLHLVIIGGVMARGSIAKSNSGLAVAPTITPPPAAPAQAAPAPAPVQPVVNTQPAPPAAPPPADTQVHITQAPVNMEAVTPAPAQPEAPVQPVAVQPAPAPAAPAQEANMKQHLIQSGDTWGRIAAQYGITEDVLKGANTELAAEINLPAGTYMRVPMPVVATPAPAPVAEAPQQAAAPEAVKYHVVKRGENPGRIARKYNLSLDTLFKLNNMKKEDARYLKVGQKLRVSE